MPQFTKRAHRNNINFKRIRLAFEMRADEVQEACRLGGIDISKERCSQWMRAPGAGAGRYSVMTDIEFDAFCAGLPELSKS